MYFSTARLQETTSCIKGKSKNPAADIAPDPVSEIVYLYFGKDDNSIKPLRLRVQYYADEWLFISNVIFNIDGKVFRFIPTKVERDSGNGGMIWEWIDEPIQDESDKELIYALVNAKSAKMKFNGSQYYKIRAISNAQLTSMRKTLELFNALGGNF